MASTATEEKALTTKPKSRYIVPVSQPIPSLPTELARVYTHVHPAVLLSLLYLTFSYLVNDPVKTLAWAIAPLGILQAAYCIVCLPPSSGSSTPPPKTKDAKKKRVQFAKPAATTRSRTLTIAISLILTLTLGAPFFNVALVLFGGPVLTHHWHNFLCATHMALLGALPLFYAHGVNVRMWREVAGAALPFDEVWGGTVGTVVGAWLGAVPIPLDWDREWQQWPITIVTGAYMGWAVFRLLGKTVFHGKRIQFDED